MAEYNRKDTKFDTIQQKVIFDSALPTCVTSGKLSGYQTHESMEKSKNVWGILQSLEQTIIYKDN